MNPLDLHFPQSSRRTFMRQAGVVSLAAGAAPAFLQAARPGGDRILVVLQLTGGNDGLNTVVPYADDEYYANRFTLGVQRKNVLTLDDHVGLHPQLNGLAETFESGNLAVVQGVGYPNPNRSHFSSMDIWQTAVLSPRARDFGWVGKTLDSIPRQGAESMPGMHLGRTADRPRAILASRALTPTVDSLLASFRMRLPAGVGEAIVNHWMSRNRAKNIPPEFFQRVRKATQTAMVSSRKVSVALSKRDKTEAAYPGFDLANAFRSVARLIDAGLDSRIYYLSLNGFDTHANQARAHSNLLQQVGNSTAAFLRDIKARGHGKRVAVMTFSEFGRRVRENGTRGTDHGTAAPMFLAGEGVRGGVFGKHPSLTDLDNGDLKFHTDFRRVYATVLEKWLGVQSKDVLGEAFELMRLFG